MPLTITIGDESPEPEEKIPAPEPKKPQATVNLDIRKTLDGDLIIRDHPEMDIVVLIKKNKIVSFPKDRVKEGIYDTQMRLFDFMSKKGVTDRGSVQAGNVYNSIESALLEAGEGVSSAQVTVLTISEFLKEEKPIYDRIKAYEEEMEDEIVDPDAEDSTELGEIPHSQRKGAITPDLYYRPYLTTYNYFYEE